MKRIITRVILIVLLAGELCLAGWYGEQREIYKFDIVQTGILYRSGQPIGEGWDRLANLYGVKTVIDLRETDKPKAPWSTEQDHACQRYGMKLIHMPMTDTKEPSPENWRKFLDIVHDPANWPVLVHCEMGTARTGVMIGGYRIVEQGLTAALACKDAQRHSFNPAKHPEYLAFWETLEKTNRTKVAQPATNPTTDP